jgi:hypothetical protein
MSKHVRPNARVFSRSFELGVSTDTRYSCITMVNAVTGHTPQNQVKLGADVSAQMFNEI